jgi:hypothetical protein
MKHPIRWHEECLANQYRHATKREAEALRAVVDAKRSLNEAHAYARQIERAKQMGKTSFDRERFTGVER